MKKVIQSFILLFCLLYSGCTNTLSQTASLPEYRVKPNSVYDGDTMRVLDSKGHEFKIRFACIDTREIGQYRGEDDRDFLRQLLDKHHNRVKLEIITTDRYNRTVAVVWARNQLVPLEQVKTGQAFVYDKYADDCPYYEKIKEAEIVARQQKIGVWSQESIVYPWDWRRRNR